MVGICAVVHFGERRTDDDTLRAMLVAGTHGQSGARIWWDGPIALAGGSGGWGGAGDWSGSGSWSGPRPVVAPTSPIDRPERVDSRTDSRSVSNVPETPLVLADARLDGRAELVQALRSGAEVDPRIAAEFGDVDDPGLIAAAHALWGDAAPARLIGDYAYFVWDPRRRRFLAVRDALGVRPLHAAWTPDRSALVLASEARMIAAHPLIPIRLDRIAAAAHLDARTPDGQRTILEGIRSIPPAHVIEVGAERAADVRVERYWSASTSRERWSDAPATSADRLRDALQRAVRDRIEGAAIGPMGVLLSGGLDSASIAAIAAPRAPAISGSPGLVAFTYAFARLRECDETGPAGRLAARHALAHIPIDAEAEWLLQDAHDLAPALDQPFQAWSSLTRRVMLTLRERGIATLFTGHGGDNMVGGSPLAYASLLQRGRLDTLGEARRDARRRGLPLSLLLWSSAIRPLLPDRAAHVARRITGRGPAWRPPPWSTALERPETDGMDDRIDFAPRPVQADRIRDPAVRAARREALELGSVGRAIMGYERTAAAFGVDVRHPFLDRRLVEMVLSVPPEHHYERGRTKALLRRAMRDDLTEEIAERADKTDFGPYLDHSLKEASRTAVEALFERPLSARIGLVDAAVLRAAYGAYRAGRLPNAGNALWAAITLELWLRAHARAIGLEDEVSFP